ncbi:MAG TPA: hypothetical protein P5239_11035, partial [Victivallales bacterium]|nr:hypothetical protein [Victivallales bacterium]
KYSDILKILLQNLSCDTICVREDFFPSNELISKIAKLKNFVVLCPLEGLPVCWSSHGDSNNPYPGAEEITCDSESIVIRYPWDLLNINEKLISKLEKNQILCEIPGGVNIDGKVKIASTAKILPGVYIEGNVIIGENCKIGPNCYIRGCSYIGNNCHIGQAVEIKNSILMENVSVGHLSYIGDTVICFNTNIGAGTITANLRHDGKNHKSDCDGKLIDTGRRKFGAIIGDNVHTGIHTSIYPGRKIWPNMNTVPGEIVKKDIK